MGVRRRALGVDWLADEDLWLCLINGEGNVPASNSQTSLPGNPFVIPPKGCREVILRHRKYCTSVGGGDCRRVHQGGDYKDGWHAGRLRG